MHAGKKYGEGLFGTTYDYSCKKRDNSTFCNMLKEKPIKAIHLHSFEKMIVLEKSSEIKKFKEHMQNLDCCVAKVFKDYFIGIDGYNFNGELEGMKIIYDIFGKQTEKETTLTSLKLFGFNFVAAFVAFEDSSRIYATFSKKCTSDLENATITEKLYKKLVRNVVETLATMQEKNFGHFDIKPDNIMYCARENRFKLIDWGLAHYMKLDARLRGPMSFTCPMTQHLAGVPNVLATRMIYYSNWKRNPDFFNSEIFQELYKMIYSEYMGILEERISSAELYKKYKKKFDLFNFGMTLAFIVFKNKLKWNKHRALIKLMVSFKGPLSAENLFKKK